MQNKMLRLFEQKVLNGLLHIGWARSLHRHDSFTARASEKSKMGERVNAPGAQVPGGEIIYAGVH